MILSSLESLWMGVLRPEAGNWSPGACRLGPYDLIGKSVKKNAASPNQNEFVPRETPSATMALLNIIVQAIIPIFYLHQREFVMRNAQLYMKA